eukprot:6190625-Pleurochrysis_carterae.AAC.1
MASLAAMACRSERAAFDTARGVASPAPRISGLLAPPYRRAALDGRASEREPASQNISNSLLLTCLAKSERRNMGYHAEAEDMMKEALQRRRAVRLRGDADSRRHRRELGCALLGERGLAFGRGTCAKSKC